MSHSASGSLRLPEEVNPPADSVASPPAAPQARPALSPAWGSGLSPFPASHLLSRPSAVIPAIKEMRKAVGFHSLEGVLPSSLEFYTEILCLIEYEHSWACPCVFSRFSAWSFGFGACWSGAKGQARHLAFSGASGWSFT